MNNMIIDYALQKKVRNGYRYLYLKVTEGNDELIYEFDMTIPSVKNYVVKYIIKTLRTRPEDQTWGEVLKSIKGCHGRHISKIYLYSKNGVRFYGQAS